MSGTLASQPLQPNRESYADVGTIGGSMMHKRRQRRSCRRGQLRVRHQHRQAGNHGRYAVCPQLRRHPQGVDLTATPTPRHVEHADVSLTSRGQRRTPAQGSGIESTASREARTGYDGDKVTARQHWREVQAAHGDAVEANVLVSQGYSMGTDVSALVKTVTDGQVLQVRRRLRPMRHGDKGDKGDQGSTGATGSAEGLPVPRCRRCCGSDGVNGSRGDDGVNGARARTARRWSFKTRRPELIGNTIRTLHVPARKGMKLVSVSAKMRRSYRQPCHGGRP